MSIPQQAFIHICNQNEELIKFNHPVFYLPDYSEGRTRFNGQDLSFATRDKMVVKMKMAGTGSLQFNMGSRPLRKVWCSSCTQNLDFVRGG